MSSANYRPPPLPSKDVTAPDVAVSSTVLTRRMNASLRQAGGFSGSGRTVTASTFLSSTDCFVWADTTAGAITLTLPFIKEYTRMWIIVERVGGANNLTISPRGSDTIDAGGSIVVTKATMLSPRTNSDWHICMVSA